MSLVEIEPGADIFRDPLKKVSQRIGGDLLDDLVAAFVGNISTSDLLLVEGEVSPHQRLKACLELAHYEGSTADLIGRALHLLWSDIEDRNHLLLAEPRFARLAPDNEFAAAVSSLAAGIGAVERKAADPAQRKLRRTIIQVAAPSAIAQLSRAIRAIVACKRLHTALLALQAATADLLSPIAGEENISVDPSPALAHVASVAASVAADLPTQLASDFQPVAAELSAASQALTAAPDALARHRAVIVIRDTLKNWPHKLADEMLALTAGLNFRCVVEIIRLNADRSLQWPLLQVSVIWRQAAFATGIWREIGQLIRDLRDIYEDLVKNGVAPDADVSIALNNYLGLLVPEQSPEGRKLTQMLDALYNAQADIENHIAATNMDPDGYKAALAAFDGASLELIEEIRFQRQEFDKTAMAMAASLAALAPALSALSQTARRP